MRVPVEVATTSREGRLFDHEILQEPRKITTGKHLLYASSPDGAIIDKLE